MVITIKKRDAIKHFGGVTALARLLGISRSAIYQWGDLVPAPTAYKIFLLSGLTLGVIDAPEGWPLKKSGVTVARAARNRALLLRAISDGHVAYLMGPKSKKPANNQDDEARAGRHRIPPAVTNGE